MKDKNMIIKEIEDLKKQNEELKLAIKRIDDKENLEILKTSLKYYRKFIYRKVPLEYLDTVFYTHKDILLEHAAGCFLEGILDVAYNKLKSINKEVIVNIPMFCNNMLYSSKGAVFTLSDPYKTITTQPMKKISQKDAMNCINKMIIAKIRIPENHRGLKVFEVKEYKLLKMDLYKTDSTYKLPKELEEFMKYKYASSEKEAIKALDQLERKYSNTIGTQAYRQKPLILRILTPTKAIGLWYEKGKLWYGDENRLTSTFPCVLNEFESFSPNKKSTFFLSDEHIIP